MCRYLRFWTRCLRPRIFNIRKVFAETGFALGGDQFAGAVRREKHGWRYASVVVGPLEAHFTCRVSHREFSRPDVGKAEIRFVCAESGSYAQTHFLGKVSSSVVQPMRL